MIHISNKSECCGCSACAATCPYECIAMLPDEEGFLYPVVDMEKCVHCNLCKNICPVSHPYSTFLPRNVYAGVHVDESIRLKSSSGGVFTALAEWVIAKGGVVFGARFDNQWNVVHGYTESKIGLSVFRGSKYVQSDVGNSYFDVKYFLDGGRLVLFSGTPCQVAGLKRFLRKDYSGLVTVDVVCHGVPSPLVWQEYVKTLMPVSFMSFRDKRAGWGKSSFVVKTGQSCRYGILQQNVFMRGFLQNLYLRPSCYHCAFRNFKSGSDLTLGDFWGVQNFYNDVDYDNGVSLVIQKSLKQDMANFPLRIIEVDRCNFENTFRGNPNLFRDCAQNTKRTLFFNEFRQCPGNLTSIIEKYTIYPRSERLKANVIHVLLYLGIYNNVRAMVQKVKK